ncbi:EAL domain-containing protein [Thiomicrospira microaerophila]|uniref:EAL domain-containing protein n=1 Tax=Thiomicrospira microaerophila TaxID=406020 RepID=UPI0005CA3424|nr:EAL domain-containing protein [Thiomicrospira microaerophila]
MTFNRQILLFITVLVLVLFLGTFSLNLSNTKGFLQNQLTSHAEDTATSLGLSLSSVADLENPASIEAMVNAVFDRGHYRLIALHDMEGELVYQRENVRPPAGVPAAFVSALTIESPQARALVQSGWMPIGHLTVQANAAYGYTELWQVFKNLLMWFGLAALLALLVAFVMIKALLKPLKQIELQADAIVKKQYVYQDDLPATLEFRQVVLAMNKMVEKLKDVFDRDAKMAEKLQRMAYQDSVTGLSNRQHFDMMFEAQLMSSEQADQGCMVLVRVEGMKALNDQFGYQLGNAFMQVLATKMVELLNVEEGIYARLNGLELIAVLPGQAPCHFKDKAQTLVSQLPALMSKAGVMHEDVALSVVLLDYGTGDKRGALMARLEFGLGQLASLSDQQVLVLGTTEADVLKDASSRRLIEYAFEHNALKLYQQVSVNGQDAVHDTELLIRMVDRDGTIRSAAYFMPAIERFNRLLELDLLVVDLALAYQSQSATKPLLAINLSPRLLRDTDALATLIAKLNEIRGAHFAFEFPEVWVTEDVAFSKSVIWQIHQLGYQVGIDNFGSRFTNMQYLQDLRPDYIKLDGAFSRCIESDEQTASYVASLCDLARILDVPVIATAVETEHQLAAFKQVGITYFQGYLFGAPAPL